jgi:dihydroceramidase
VLTDTSGWWHLMTGIGAYCYIVWGIWLRHCLNGRQDEFELIWPTWWTLPRVEKVEALNGSAIKSKGS